jgi:hypothetical protein
VHYELNTFKCFLNVEKKPVQNSYYELDVMKSSHSKDSLAYAVTCNGVVQP